MAAGQQFDGAWCATAPTVPFKSISIPPCHGASRRRYGLRSPDFTLL